VPGGLLLAGLPAFGWAKPVPVIKGRLRNPRFGMMAVAAAGPGMNLVLGVIGALALGLLARGHSAPPDGIVGFVFVSLRFFILINVFLALFNLLPLPPFDGSHIVEGLLPPRAARVYEKLRPFGFPLLFLLLLVIPYFFPGLGIVENVVLPPVEWAEQWFMRIAMWVAGE
jgi:Zn-dependent protease